MAVALLDLVPAIRGSLNVPGDARPQFNFDDEDAWVESLANAFWQAKMRGFFTDFRVNADNEIINVAAGDDMERQVQQVIVLFASMLAVEAKMMTLFTGTRDKAGPVETERQRSSTLLRALLDGKRAELEDIKKTLVNGSGTTVAVIDAILTRNYYGMPWVR